MSNKAFKPHQALFANHSTANPALIWYRNQYKANTIKPKNFFSELSHSTNIFFNKTSKTPEIIRAKEKGNPQTAPDYLPSKFKLYEKYKKTARKSRFLNIVQIYKDETHFKKISWLQENLKSRKTAVLKPTPIRHKPRKSNKSTNDFKRKHKEIYSDGSEDELMQNLKKKVKTTEPKKPVFPKDLFSKMKKGLVKPKISSFLGVSPIKIKGKRPFHEIEERNPQHDEHQARSYEETDEGESVSLKNIKSEKKENLFTTPKKSKKKSCFLSEKEKEQIMEEIDKYLKTQAENICKEKKVLISIRLFEDSANPRVEIERKVLNFGESKNEKICFREENKEEIQNIVKINSKANENNFIKEINQTNDLNLNEQIKKPIEITNILYEKIENAKEISNNSENNELILKKIAENIDKNEAPTIEKLSENKSENSNNSCIESIKTKENEMLEEKIEEIPLITPPLQMNELFSNQQNPFLITAPATSLSLNDFIQSNQNKSFQTTPVPQPTPINNINNTFTNSFLQMNTDSLTNNLFGNVLSNLNSLGNTPNINQNNNNNFIISDNNNRNNQNLFFEEINMNGCNNNFNIFGNMPNCRENYSNFDFTPSENVNIYTNCENPIMWQPLKIEANLGVDEKFASSMFSQQNTNSTQNNLKGNLMRKKHEPQKLRVNSSYNP